MYYADIEFTPKHADTPAQDLGRCIFPLAQAGVLAITLDMSNTFLDFSVAIVIMQIDESV